MKKGLRRSGRLIRLHHHIPTADLMKKGLRPDLRHLVRQQHHSNRRPDEEGIKTSLLGLVTMRHTIPTADLMKKGLRPGRLGERYRERGIPTADLMKKGLRPTTSTACSGDIYSNRRPDEEGIKTLMPRRMSAWRSIPTADLMKKGLRRISLIALLS